MTVWSKNTPKGRLRLSEELRAPSAPPGCRSQLKPGDRCSPQDTSQSKPPAIKTTAAFTGKCAQNNLRESSVPPSDGADPKARPRFAWGQAPFALSPRGMERTGSLIKQPITNSKLPAASGPTRGPTLCCETERSRVTPSSHFFLKGCLKDGGQRTFNARGERPPRFPTPSTTILRLLRPWHGDCQRALATTGSKWKL